jgi:cbb3-type cytochrome oxidase subunit 3
MNQITDRIPDQESTKRLQSEVVDSGAMGYGSNRGCAPAKSTGGVMLQQWIFLICAVAAFIFILVCWVWPIYRTKALRKKDREKAAELEDDYRKTVAQVLGGAALVVGFSWTFLKDQRTLEQSLHDSAGKQFAEVAKLLDSSKSAAPSRAAGIYAFESVVNA